MQKNNKNIFEVKPNAPEKPYKPNYANHSDHHKDLLRWKKNYLIGYKEAASQRGKDNYKEYYKKNKEKFSKRHKINHKKRLNNMDYMIKKLNIEHKHKEYHRKSFSDLIARDNYYRHGFSSVKLRNGGEYRNTGELFLVKANLTKQQKLTCLQATNYLIEHGYDVCGNEIKKK